jgi:hypothetical protein
METAPGFVELTRSFSDVERRSPLGRSCPLVPEFRDPGPKGGGGAGRPPSPWERDGNGAAGRMVRSLADWICRSVVPTFVYRKFEFEKPGEPFGAALATNSHLFLLSDELQQRSGRLGGVLADAVEAKDPVGPLLFAGCYLGGTGTGPAEEQAFVKGVFDRLTKWQSCVYWTKEARDKEASYQRWVNFGLTTLAVFLAAIAVLGLIKLIL